MRELSARWVACTAASGRCGRLRAVVGSRDRGEKPRCLVAVENFGDLPQPPDHVQIPYQGSGVMHLGSADLQATGVLVAVRRYEWLQGTSRLEATVLLAADVLLLQSRRFVANIKPCRVYCEFSMYATLQLICGKYSA